MSDVIYERALAWLRGRRSDDAETETLVNALVATMNELGRAEGELRELKAALREAHHVGRQLMGMVDRQTWRDQGGDDGQGHYEGDYYAEKVSESIESWGKLAGDGGGA